MYTLIIPAILAVLTVAVITFPTVIVCLKSFRETKMRIQKENLVLRAKLAIAYSNPKEQDDNIDLTGCGMFSHLQILLGGNSDEEDN
ncbi:MAG: hypothetical protein PHW01_04305 [Patescibacteria group bacterium]|nr:hypothetical protein [Patescibacteria group bacterium]